MGAGAKSAKSDGAAIASELAGTTQRWTFEDGPTAGKTYEHTFHEDGTVSFREVKGGKEPAAAHDGGKEGDRPKYGVARVTDDVLAISYLSKAGYTLTVVQNEVEGSLHGFASGAKEWYPVHGTFERVD